MITAQKLHQADKCSPSPRPFSALRSSAVLTEESTGRTKVRDIHIDCRSSSVTDAGCFFLKHLHNKWNFFASTKQGYLVYLYIRYLVVILLQAPECIRRNLK